MIITKTIYLLFINGSNGSRDLRFRFMRATFPIEVRKFTEGSPREPCQIFRFSRGHVSLLRFGPGLTPQALTAPVLPGL
jgi:hypothetical protein